MTPEQKVLLKAAKLIEQHGWVQGWSGSTQHGFCMYGAIKEASALTGEESGMAFERLQKFFLPEARPSIVNDDEYTDPTQAICALTGAAMMEI